MFPNRSIDHRDMETPRHGRDEPRGAWSGSYTSPPLQAASRVWQVDNFRNRVFAPAVTAMGLEDMHVHDLRHTAASLMILSGATVKDVQNALGHASGKMTLDLYAGWWDEGLDDVGRRMDSLLA